MNKISLDLNEFRGEKGQVHFVGCAGVGTQPLMKIFHEANFRVSGSDLIDNAKTQELRKLGLRIGTGHAPENLPPDDGSRLLVIYSSAAAPDNPELTEARKRGGVLLRRGEALGMMSSVFRRVVSVSGSHGKTSISSMIAWGLRACGKNTGFLIGGALTGWMESGCYGDGDCFVCEVDESDGTHAFMHSAIGIVPNVEDDHAWSVGGEETLFHNFRQYAKNTGRLLYVAGEHSDQLFAAHPNVLRLPSDIAENPALSLFHSAALAKWGRYQKLNALCALAVMTELGIPAGEAAAALEIFPGVERRMTQRFDNGYIRIVEDYAHHPTELAAALETLRELNPSRRLLVLFQPHRYARLERYFDRFAVLLKTADHVFVTPVFAAWTASGKVGSSDLARAIGDNAEYLEGSWNDIAEKISCQLKNNDLIAVIGAGDLKEVISPLIALADSGIRKAPESAGSR